ncbi:MAG: hypothetical protein R2762_29160 [Bryobacteraceae bacterium]
MAAQFRAQLREEIDRTRQRHHDDARKVYNAMIDKKPRLIAQSWM